jgi:putative polyhydroxyalkanoate system protein
MPKVNLEQRHTLSTDEVKKRLENLMAQLGAKYGVTARWTGANEAEIKATGTTGKISCGDGVVRVVLDLSFALTPVKGKVEQRVAQELKNALA